MSVFFYITEITHFDWVIPHTPKFCAPTLDHTPPRPQQSVCRESISRETLICCATSGRRLRPPSQPPPLSLSFLPRSLPAHSFTVSESAGASVGACASLGAAIEAPADGAASVVWCAGDEEEREGSEPHEESRTPCRLTIELDEEPLCPPRAAAADPARPPPPPPAAYQQELACCCPAA